jgi:hypothetical protein
MSSVRQVNTARFPSLTKAGSMSRHRSRRTPRSPWWPISFSASAISSSRPSRRSVSNGSSPCPSSAQRPRNHVSGSGSSAVYAFSATKNGMGAEGSARHARAVSVCSWRSNILLPAPGAPNTTTAFAGARRANWASRSGRSRASMPASAQRPSSASRPWSSSTRIRTNRSSMRYRSRRGSSSTRWQ